MAVLDNVVVFVASLLIGGLGIHVGAMVIASSKDYGHAVVTAALGAIVWAVVNTVVGGIPLLGPVLVLLAYLLVIRLRYGVGWLAAGGIALVAWVAVLVVLYLLATVGVTSFEATGVPGV
ncbi:hypothetical protein N0B31_03720 [Salinirubellus salinus]|uniref:Uncharacterized protein n=1 Tax=Salinirubellus salinus TaxID=1364945 RepID=A0A9E7UBP0_9EURY|nr:hypothetical protein [Salinirubellus salinus]UWM55398.1 hypothetical protein N0B31_03720 [Salinirubellus salinus]